MSKKCSEKSFYFHLDPELVGNTTTFHFHVLLERPGGRSHRPAPKPTSGAAVTFCEPPDGTPVVRRVRDSGSGFGSICVIGTATVSSGVLPEEVWGKIYPCDSDIPSGIPSDAFPGEIVNDGSSPDFPCQSECDGCNFVFHNGVAGELGGAQHSSSPEHPCNEIAIWLKFDDSVYGPFRQRFYGKTDATSECGDSGSGYGFPIVATKALTGPEKYRLVSQGPFPPSGNAAILHRQGAEAGSLLTWSSCPKANPEVQWKLWGIANGGTKVGTLALQNTDGNRLNVPLIWKCNDWRPYAENRFTFASPEGSPHSGSELIAELV